MIIIFWLYFKLDSILNRNQSTSRTNSSTAAQTAVAAGNLDQSNSNLEQATAISTTITTATTDNNNSYYKIDEVNL